MNRRRIVVALGGNALGNTTQEQLQLVKTAAVPIADLIEEGHSVILTHGNGPQVGMINLALSFAAQHDVVPADVPLPECGAMSQGYIGYHLQNALQNELKKRGIDRSVATVITQVVVDADDPAFSCPTKPIGGFYTREQMENLCSEKGFKMIFDSGRGYRRVVPSPKPVDIVEKDVIFDLVEQGVIPITGGGGGIPVVKNEFGYTGVCAVVDKDFSASVLAQRLQADLFIILTAVDAVAINYGKPDQKSLRKLTVEQAERYCLEGQFAAGSMLPKIQAAIRFAQTGKPAIIAGLGNAGDAVSGKSGTIITM